LLFSYRVCASTFFVLFFPFLLFLPFSVFIYFLRVFSTSFLIFFSPFAYPLFLFLYLLCFCFCWYGPFFVSHSPLFPLSCSLSSNFFALRSFFLSPSPFLPPMLFSLFFPADLLSFPCFFFFSLFSFSFLLFLPTSRSFSVLYWYMLCLVFALPRSSWPFVCLPFVRLPFSSFYLFFSLAAFFFLFFFLPSFAFFPLFLIFLLLF